MQSGRQPQERHLLAANLRGMAREKGTYAAYVVRAYTKETLAVRIAERIEAYPQEAIVKIQAGIDFHYFWPFRRNWAVIVVKRPEAPAI